MSKRFIALSLFIIGAVVLLAFQTSLASGFFLDDWRFLRIAGLSVLENLSIYFDPRQQFQWYRPLHGLEYLLSYRLFDGNAAPVHLARTLLHFASCGLLFVLVKEISGKWRIGLVAGLVFAVLHGDSTAVIWIADESLYQVFFFLLALCLWWRFLRNESARFYWLSFIAFLLALLSKEASLSLPVLFFLMEYLLNRKEFKWRAVFRRYVAFGVAWTVYFLIEIYIRLNGTPDWFFEGYKPGIHIFTSLIDYMALVVFPWGLPSPLNYLWLILVTGLLVYLVIFKKNRVLFFLIISAVLTILPFAPFGGTKGRYFYMPSLVSAVLLAMVAERVGEILARCRLQWIVAGTVTGVLVLAAQQVADTAWQFAGLARVDRAPLRAITATYPRLPPDTRVFFIEPTNDLRDLSGMLFVRYGAGVTARGTDRDGRVRLREQPSALVVYRDETEEYRIVPVESANPTRAAPSLPRDFEDGVRLTSYELARSTLRRGDPIVLFFNWQAERAVPHDYTVFVHLVDQNGNSVGGYDSEPREGKTHTSGWMPGQVVLDWIIFPSPADAPAGDYFLEIGLYHAPTMRRLAVLDADGNPVGDKIVISPLQILP
jgi:hypothetical protein